MKKLIIILVALVTFGIEGKGQQLQQWTQFYLNEFTVNPTVAGNEKYFRAFAQYRDQWSGITDSPRTSYISVDGPVWKESMGAGVSIYSDVTGSVRRTGFQASYAYRIKLNDKYKLGFSLSAGVLQYSVDAGKIELERSLDPALSNNWSSVWVPDFGLGTRFEAKNWHVGFYVPQVTGSKVQFFQDFPETENLMNQHFYLSAGYRYDFAGTDIAVEGNFLGRYVSPVDAFDFQVRGIYKDMVWAGVLYRTPFITGQNPLAVGIMAGYQYKNNLTIGYSYDISMTSAALGATHEVILGIRFSKKNNKPLVEF